MSQYLLIQYLLNAYYVPDTVFIRISLQLHVEIEIFLCRNYFYIEIWIIIPHITDYETET